MSRVKLMLGDNILSLRKLPNNSIDSIVTDPPYGLSFMNKKWDYEVPSVEFWKEVYRVLKPGGHILSFGGTRTYHRMVVNIEDAGFEIRDQIQWLYGSGFPKSMNIGKAYDSKNGNKREIIGVKEGKINLSKIEVGDKSMYDNAWSNKEYINLDITKGTSEYEGLGTGLKPANEPICLARKPISEKTILDNVIKWGTGGLNIDGSRIGTDNIPSPQHNRRSFEEVGLDNGNTFNGNYKINEGRFPSNLILDEEAGKLLDDQSGFSKSNCVAGTIGKTAGIFQDENGKQISGHKVKLTPTTINDSGGASRFFYCAKVSKQERNLGLGVFEEKEVIRQGLNGEHKNPTYKNSHPTIKPINLMVYLIKLINPKNGIVLDPFMGSGSTGIASQLLGFKFCGMEMDEDYFKIAEERINNFELYRKFIKNRK